MSRKQTCTSADVSRGLRLIRHIIAAIQMVMPFAASADAVIVTMLMGASLRHNKGR